MFNDPIIRAPINGTAARVASQVGCSVELTPKQEREGLILHVNQIESVILTLPKKSKERKDLGLKKLELCKEISKLNEKMKKINIGTDGRSDYTDCVFDVMREQLSNFQYKQIMRLAREMYSELKLDKGVRE